MISKSVRQVTLAGFMDIVINNDLYEIDCYLLYNCCKRMVQY